MRNIVKLICLVFIGSVVGTLTLPYAVNSWLVYFGKHAVVVWWHGAIVGAIPGCGWTCATVAFITWISMWLLR